MSSPGQATLPYLVDICVQLTSGLRHLHACGVLHRDLKTDNALVQSLQPLVVKWADFGCSVKLMSSATSAGVSACIIGIYWDVDGCVFGCEHAFVSMDVCACAWLFAG